MEEFPTVQEPSLIEASQYPCFVFHTSSRPSPSVFWTVVLTITAPHDTHPPWLLFGTTIVVAEALSSFIGFDAGFEKVQVVLSQLPYQPGKGCPLV